MKLATLECAAATLNTHLLGRPLRAYSAVSSTQEIARAEAEQGAAEGLAVVASEQVAGRGRLGREWWSPPTGGLYLSLLLRPRLPAERLAWVTMAVALGAAEAVEQATGLPVDLKWPNDLEVRGRKVAGILAEGAFVDGRLAYVIAGLGLNVDMDFSGQPDLQARATSLSAELGQPVAEEALLAPILEHIEQHYLALSAGVSPVSAWSARLVTLGQPVEVSLADGRRLAGLAEQVEPDGALRLRLADGRLEIVRAGDVSLRRLPA